MVGKVIARVAVGVTAAALAAYANYRLAGGPPIVKLYKEVKKQRSEKNGNNKVKIFLDVSDYAVE